MKKTTWFIIFILIFFLAGCAEKEPESDIIVPTEYIFEGENDLWKGEYRVSGFQTFAGEDPSQFHGNYEYTLTVTYLGEPEDLFEVKQLEIRSQGELKESAYQQDFLKVEHMETAYTVKYRSQSLDILEHETIHVFITMDDKTEKLELTSK